MSSTLWRWGGGVVVGCGALVALLIPFPPSVAERWSDPVPKPLAQEVSRLSADLGRAQSALRTYRAATGLERWRTEARASDTTRVRMDRSVPAGLAPSVRAAALQQWSTLGAATAAHAEIFFYVDSAPLARAGTAATSRRSLEPRRFVDVAFALPEATAGTRCVSLVRLTGTSPAHVEALGRQSLLGVCGFFAAFGLPGAANRDWLAATGYRVARRSDWHIALAPFTDAAAVYGLGAAGSQCLTGEPGACLVAVGATGSTRSQRGQATRAEFVLDGTAAFGGGDQMRAGSLGTVEVELLMSAVREFGPERFARFWSSSAPPDAAFATATGVALDMWVQRWMVRSFGTLPERPTPRVSRIIWLIASAPVLLRVAARPRERVLADRWRARRH